MVRATVGDWWRNVVYGEGDPRVRATWRVLLAMPLLWVLTGDVLTANLIAAIALLPTGDAFGSGVAASVLHGGFLLLALAFWATYFERRSLSDYGISISRSWAGDFFVGLGAVVVGQTLWLGLSSMLPGKSIQLGFSTPSGSIIGWLVMPFLALVLHAAVQQVVFFRVILRNAAEGLFSRGVTARHATLVAVPVAVVFFIAMHGSTTPLRILDLAIAGSIFGLLYLHTGELGLGIGAHFGAFFSGIIVLRVVQVTGSFSGVMGQIDQYGFPKLAIAYLVLVGWLKVRHGRLPLKQSVAAGAGERLSD